MVMDSGSVSSHKESLPVTSQLGPTVSVSVPVPPESIRPATLIWKVWCCPSQRMPSHGLLPHISKVS